MSNQLRDEDYLEHMLEAATRIQRYVAGKSEGDFASDDLLQDGVIRNLEVIGEAVAKLTPEMKAAHANVPWGLISGMRNRLIHGYMSINLQIVWDTVRKVVPQFATDIVAIRQGLVSRSKPTDS